MRYPIVHNNGKWHHIASDEEIKIAMRGKVEPIEIPMLGMSYFVSWDHLTLVRCGGTLGGDTRDIECAWVYSWEVPLNSDLAELRRLERHPANSVF